MIHILARIKELCAQRGIKSLAELEHSSGLSPRTIYKWDDQKPSVDKAAAVAKTLGATVDDLLRDDPVEENARNGAPDELSKHIDN